MTGSAPDETRLRCLARDRDRNGFLQELKAVRSDEAVAQETYASVLLDAQLPDAYRMKAMVGLRTLGHLNSAGIAALTETTKQKGPDLRLTALAVLTAELPREPAIELLTRLIDSPKADVRVAAWGDLAGLGDDSKWGEAHTRLEESLSTGKRKSERHALYQYFDAMVEGHEEDLRELLATSWSRFEDDDRTWWEYAWPGISVDFARAPVSALKNRDNRSRALETLAQKLPRPDSDALERLSVDDW